jgi:protease I
VKKTNAVKAAVLLENLYEDTEFWYPYLRLQEAGLAPDVVAPAKGEYTSKHGLPATADVTAEAAVRRNYGLVVIPGGYSPDRMRRDRNMVDVVRRAAASNNVVAAICHGPWMLNSAGISKGRKMTSFFSIKDDLVAAGAKWIDQPVVRDGNLVTAQGPKDLPEFMKLVLEALGDVITAP